MTIDVPAFQLATSKSKKNGCFFNSPLAVKRFSYVGEMYLNIVERILQNAFQYFSFKYFSQDLTFRLVNRLILQRNLIKDYMYVAKS